MRLESVDVCLVRVVVHVPISHLSRFSFCVCYFLFFPFVCVNGRKGVNQIS